MARRVSKRVATLLLSASVGNPTTLTSLATVATVATVQTAAAQSMYDIDNGLSHNTVRCVAQDSHGFMWFGTARGLSRFDGRHYKNFYAAEADSTALGSNSIHSLFADSGGDLWVGTAAGVYIYNHKRNTFTRFTARTAGDVYISTTVNSISDDGNRLWIGTQGQGLFAYDRATGELLQNSLHSSMVSTVVCGRNGAVYSGSEMGTISQLTSGAVHVGAIYSDHSTDGQRNSEITSMCVRGDTIWFSSSSGRLKSLVRDTGGGFRVKSWDSVARHATSIFSYDSRTLWIGTASGIEIFDTATGRSGHMADDRYINDIYRDREGGIWLATQYGGVSYVPRRLKSFETGLSDNPEGPGALIVNAFCRDGSGRVWVGTWNGGLICLDEATGARLPLPLRRPLPGVENIQCLMLDGNDLWIGTHSQGVWVLDTVSGRVRNFRHDRDNPSSLADNSVNVIYRDRAGVIHIGTEWGLNRWEPATGGFHTESRTGNQANISDILEDGEGNLWFASTGTGVFRLSAGGDSWSAFRRVTGSGSLSVSDRVACLFEDSSGRIWAGTDMGLCWFDRRDGGGFVPFEPTGTTLPAQSVSSIEQDSNGFLWVSTGAGLLCIDVNKGVVVNHFTHTDELQGNQFNHRSSMRSPDGRLYFGGIDGFNSFHPEKFRSNTHVPRTVLTALRVNGREITPDMASGPLSEAIHMVRKIKLNSRQNSLSFDFSSMSYQSPGQNRYSFRLAGWDTDWSIPRAVGEATYSNLPPGRYRFEVVGSNNDGLWSVPATLDVTIRPPLHLSWSAWLVYTVALCGGVAGIARTIAKRRRRRLKEYVAEHEKASYRNKIEFFTNLAHEIRTPLTLIKIPLESIISSGDGNVHTRKFLDIMNKNAGRLLGSINQLLDLRKSEEAGYRLTPRPCDVSTLVMESCERFRPALEIRGVSIAVDIKADGVTEAPMEGCVFCVDADAMCKIVDNLISNAAKYATRVVTVSLVASTDGFTLTVADDGEGIARDGTQDRIFEPFYQADGSRAGTGIGLPLARVLTEKHGGTIAVESDKGLGARFIVSIPRLTDTFDDAENTVETRMAVDIAGITTPVDLNAEASLDTASATPAAPSSPAANGDETAKPTAEPAAAIEPATVLIVDDNDELRSLLIDVVGANHRVLAAENGLAALHILEDNDVDIVVSDIVMPEMDGYQLTEFVKSNIRYSHIPVIQLTARASMKDRMKGLEYGSDAYIEKPFSADHLLCQIANLLDNRRRLRAAWHHATLYGNDAPVAGASDRDDKFIEKLNAEIERNIQNEHFYLDTLADSMCMSRSNFYRKIKSLFDVSPNEYLRRYRLKKAAEMLRGGRLQPSDVYMLVGFNSLSYFSTCFKNYYGTSPSRF
jgi:signal transduction histidine kinase/ligand-binding sensor domain-containing protein/DNA-binding response OmpR family regulator